MSQSDLSPKDSVLQAFSNSHKELNESLKKLGIRSSNFIDPKLAHLAGMDAEKTERALSTIKLFTHILNEKENEQSSLWETHKLIDYTFRQLRLKAADEFLSTLENDDIVEGYDLNHCQIFRNLRFMEVCSYTLHDVLTIDWPTLFERSQMITANLIEHINTVVTTGRTVSLQDVPFHYMKERMSAERQLFRVRFRFMSPVFSGAGQPAGYLVSSKADIITEIHDNHELRFI